MFFSVFYIFCGESMNEHTAVWSQTHMTNMKTIA